MIYGIPVIDFCVSMDVNNLFAVLVDIVHRCQDLRRPDTYTHSGDVDVSGQR